MKRILIVTLSLVFLFGGALSGISQIKDQTKTTPTATPAKTPVAAATISGNNAAQTKAATTKKRTVVKKKKQPNYEYLAYLESVKTRQSQERTEAAIIRIEESQTTSAGVLTEIKTTLGDFTGFAKPLLTKIDSAVTSISAWTGYTYAVAWWFVAAMMFIAAVIVLYGLVRGVKALLAWNNTREPLFQKRGYKIT